MHAAVRVGVPGGEPLKAISGICSGPPMVTPCRLPVALILAGSRRVEKASRHDWLCRDAAMPGQ